MKKSTLGKLIVALIFLLITLVGLYYYFVRGFPNLPSNPYRPKNTTAYWESKSAVPVNATDGVGADWQTEIYFAGGYGDLGITLNQVFAYSPETNEWRSLPTLIEPRNHGLMAGVGNQLLFIGGYASDGKAQSNVYSYSKSTASWVAKKNFPVGIAAATATEYGGKIYVFGGVNHLKQLNKNVFIYDPIFDKWDKINQIPTLREHLASAVLNGEIYVIAGRTGGFETNLDVVEIYKPQTNEWRTGPTLKVKRGGTAASQYKGAIYVFGGEATHGTIAEVERLKLSSSSWETVGKMPHPRHGLGVATTTKGIFVFSGGKNPGLSLSNINDLFVP